MESSKNKLNILIVGATGHLGSLITKHCLKKPNLLVNILVRDPEKNKELVTQVEDTGGKVLQGDLTKPSTLTDCTKGMHTVISAISAYGEETVGNNEVMVKGQTALVEDCIKNQVKRFVPSNFGLNYDQFPLEEISSFSTFFEDKVKFFEYLKTLPIQILHIKVGLFMESYFETQKKRGFGYWGDIDQAFNLTCYEDAAKFTAEAVSRENQDGLLVFIGENITIRQIAETYNQVRKTEKEPKKLSSYEDLKKQYEEKKKEGKTKEADNLGIPVVLYDKRSKFESNNNGQFPQIKPTSLKEFLEQNPDITLS